MFDSKRKIDGFVSNYIYGGRVSTIGTSPIHTLCQLSIDSNGIIDEIIHLDTIHHLAAQ